MQLSVNLKIRVWVKRGMILEMQRGVTTEFSYRSSSSVWEEEGSRVCIC